MKHEHLNYIVLHDGEQYYLFERLGKNVPFEAYNPNKAIKNSKKLESLFTKNSESLESKTLGSSSIDFPKNREVPRYEVEETPYEVVFNE